MAEVTGSIGNEHVELNNAATESTLRALLSVAKGDSATLTALATKAGVDATAIKAVSDASESTKSELNGVTRSSKKLAEAQETLYIHSQMVDTSLFGVVESLKQMTSGTATVSGILKHFENMPGPLGAVASGFAKLAEFQEANMKAYQQTTTAGINFGGSLSDLRVAASKTYMSLEKFSEMVTANGSTLAKLGGTVNDGAKAFTHLSHELLSSNLGTELLSLGYTTDQVNQGMLTYFNATGGRSKQELSNTAAITAATGEYLTELDKLTQFSGVSRKQQEEDAKKAASNAAYQQALSNMTEDQKARAEIARQAAANSGIAGAQDAYMAKIAGLPPLTADAQKFVGTFGEAANGINAMADQVTNVNGSMKGVEAGFGQFNQGVKRSVDGLGLAGPAIAMQGNTMVNGAMLYANQLKKSGNDTAAGTAENFAKISASQSEQQKSQAADMAASQKTLQEFNQVLIGLIAPIAGLLTPVLRYLGPLFIGLSAAVVAYKAVVVGMELFERAKMARQLATESGGGLLSMGKNFTSLGGNKTASPIAAVTGGTASGGTASGGGIGGMLKSLASGMKRLGDPKVMLGAVTLGLIAVDLGIASLALEKFSNVSWVSMAKGFVTLMGLGALAAVMSFAAPLIVAGSLAIGILGVSLLPFAIAANLAGPGMMLIGAGLKTMGEVNAMGILALVPALVALGVAMIPFSIGGAIAGSGADSFSKIANGLYKLDKVNPAKLIALSASMREIGGAIQDVGGMSTFEKIGAFASSFLPSRSSKISGEEKSNLPKITSSEMYIVNGQPVSKEEYDQQVAESNRRARQSGLSDASESPNTHLEKLNSTMDQMLEYMKRTAESTKATHDATRSLNGDLYAR